MIHELWGLRLEDDQYYMKIAYIHLMDLANQVSPI